jgi:hypothetical protein
MFRVWPLFTLVFYLLEFRKTFVLHLISYIYVSKVNVVSLNLVLHYSYMLKKNLFLKCPAFIIIHLVTL